MESVIVHILLQEIILLVVRLLLGLSTADDHAASLTKSCS